MRSRDELSLSAPPGRICDMLPLPVSTGILFEQELFFRMTFDNLGWTGPRYDDYTSVCYWYQDKPDGL